MSKNNFANKLIVFTGPSAVGKDTVEVEVMKPVVRRPMDDDAKNESTMRPIFEKNEVEVADVESKVGNVETAVDVAVTISSNGWIR